MEDNDMPKFRLEHSVSAQAGCQRASCKRQGIKIDKGELRIGTWTYFEQDDKYITFWRHWGCATPHQIKGLKQIAGDKPEECPGFQNLSAESQEQVRHMFEHGKVLDTEFKDVRPDLAVASYLGSGGEIVDAINYKVDVASTGRAGCRNTECKKDGIKILKGELRFGIATTWDSEHESWVYKHWKCISKYDMMRLQAHYRQEEHLEGEEGLPQEYRDVVHNSLEKNEAIEPPHLKPDPPKAKRKVGKKKGMKEGNEDLKTATKRSINDVEVSSEAHADAEYPAPKKKRGHRDKKSVPPAAEQD